LELVKSLKDQDAIVNGRGRLFTWEELQNDLQLSVTQRINEISSVGNKNLNAQLNKMNDKRPKTATPGYTGNGLEDSFDQMMNIRD